MKASNKCQTEQYDVLLHPCCACVAGWCVNTLMDLCVLPVTQSVDLLMALPLVMAR